MLKRHRVAVDDFLSDELADAALGDERLVARLGKLIDAIARSPSESFPKIASDESELEATYRFFGNERVHHEAILAAHVGETAKRCAQAKAVVVAHDTTEMSFGQFERRDLGRVGGGKSFGFHAHFAIAVTADGDRLPLGTLAMETHRRSGMKKRLRKEGKPQHDTERESLRWRRVFDEAHEKLDGHASAIHVMDREADDYALMSHIASRGGRFVIRQFRKRTLDDRESRMDVRETMEKVEFVAERDVQLSPRRPHRSSTREKLYRARKTRLAKLAFRATRVVLPPPRNPLAHEGPELSVHLIHVREIDVAVGVEPIEWWLWTNEPARTPDEILAVVDAYRARWIIEEFFKALKTGCAYEARQLESLHSLLNALAVFTPVAWRLLLLRQLPRTQPNADARKLLDALQIVSLRAAFQHFCKRQLPQRLTTRDAMLAIARLGGHIRHNGDPGWIVLRRGLDKLLVFDAGYGLGKTAGNAINR